MKTAEEIKKEITEANARIRTRENENEADADKIITAWEKAEAMKAAGKNISPREIAATEAERAHNDKITARIAEREQENKRDRIRRAILRENLKAAAAETVKKELRAIFDKYAGKPYGEKTRAKIDEEAKTKCGFYIHIGERYGSAEVKAYKPGFSKDEDITLYARDIPAFDGELKNRIRKITDAELDAFVVAYERARYTEPEQIDAAIDEIIAAHKAAEEAEKAYNAAVARYNDLRPNANEAAKTMYNGVPRL